MAVGESVSNGVLWDTRRPRKGNIALPSIGALFGGTYSTILTRGTKIRNTETNRNFKESSALRESNKGFKSEGPQIGAAGRSPVCSGLGRAPHLGIPTNGVSQGLR